MHQTHRALGILGGTFDPIHMGHLRMALEIYEALDLVKIHLIPCLQPVHRKLPIATPEQRLEMVRCAIANEPALMVDDREILRNEPSYMIDTLKSIREELPETPLCLLLGIDAFLGFTSWNRWEEIAEMAHLVIAHRPQYRIPETGQITELLKSHLQHNTSYVHENMGGGIILHPITSLDISATEIRKQIAMGKSPRYLMPDNVYEYIKNNSIYSISKI